MKKFFIKLICYALALLILPAVFFCYVQSTPRAFGGLIGSIRQKNIILKQTEAPRIIIVGGSSAPYSVISSEVEKAFNMPCINMGATAYFGIEFYLSAVEPELKSGDIVVLAPEFNIYNGGYTASIVWGGIENDASLLFKLPLSYIPKMFSGFFEYYKTKTDLQKSKQAVDGQGFTAFGFGAHGDIVTHRDNILEHKYNTQDMHNINADILSKGTVKAVNRFYDKAIKKGAKVYWTAAPLNRLSLQSDIADIDSLETRFKNECKVPVLGSLRDGVMSEDLFFDSNFHLNSIGAEIFTARLTENLAACLAE